MSDVFKNFNSGEKKLTTAVTHKEWTINAQNSGSYGFKVLDGFYVSQSRDFNPQDTLAGSAAAESSAILSNELPTTIYYKALIHASVNHLYYEGNDNPYDTFCNPSPHLDYRESHINTTVFSIPQTIIGEKIKPGSLSISSSAYELNDDGNGNLYDPNNYTGSLVATLSSSMMFIPFSDAFKYDADSPTLPAKTEVIDISTIRVDSTTDISATGYNIWYEDSNTSNKSFGYYANFNGSLSSYSGSGTVAHPTDTSVVELENTQTFEMPDEWTISTRVYVPMSQSVSQSYTGPSTGTDGYREKSLGGVHNHNTIATAREWYGGHNAFELSIYNCHTPSLKGQVHFTCNSKANGGKSTSITSTTRINDDDWHNIVVTSNGVDVYMFIDGNPEGTDTDEIKGFTTRTRNKITLGARRYGHKARYKNPRTDRWHSVKENVNYITPFSGSIDLFTIIPQSVATSAEYSSTSLRVNALSASLSQTNKHGNVFYDHGLAVTHAPSYGDFVHPGNGSAYSTAQLSAAGWEVKFKGTHQIKEHLYICNILDGEFNATYNPTAREKFDVENSNLQAYTTHSEFNPYVTTIGLYDDYYNLVAVGKLAQPIKNQDDYDNTFQVRFDTTI